MFKLLDGELMAAQYPDSFEVPGLMERIDLAPGDRVKLCFQRLGVVGPDEPSGERMWCEVTTVSGATYTGRLLNDPAFVSGVVYGDDVIFEACNVLDIKAKQ